SKRSEIEGDRWHCVLGLRVAARNALVASVAFFGGSAVPAEEVEIDKIPRFHIHQTESIHELLSSYIAAIAFVDDEDQAHWHDEFNSPAFLRQLLQAVEESLLQCGHIAYGLRHVHPGGPPDWNTKSAQLRHRSTVQWRALTRTGFSRWARARGWRRS